MTITTDRVLCHGRIETSTVKGARNAVLVNVSQQEDAAGGSDEQEFLGVAGVYCRPMPPDDDGACEVVSMKEQDGDPVLASRDLRISKRVNPAVGENGIAHYGGGYLTMRWDEDNRGTLVVLSAPRLDSSLNQIEEAHGLIMDPSDAQNGIMLLHRRGTALVMNADGDVFLSNGDGTGRFTIYDDGSAALRCDAGLKISGASIVGDVTLAREVALHQEIADFFTTVITALTVLSTQVKSAPLFAAGIDAQVAELIVRLATFNATGKAQTLKASPQ